MIGVAAVAIALFVSTNLDDLFVLLAFFSDRRFRTREIVAGQLLGISLLTGGSWALSRGTTVLPPHVVGWLGLAPALLGVWMLVRKKDDDDAPPKGVGMIAIAGVTIANGADNVAAYIPFFALRAWTEALVVVGVFAAMTIVWCLLAHHLVRHRTLGAPIRRWGGRLLPFVLVALGVWIFVEAGAYRTFTR